MNLLHLLTPAYVHKGAFSTVHLNRSLSERNRTNQAKGWQPKVPPLTHKRHALL
jgi:hypothetical protein